MKLARAVLVGGAISSAAAALGPVWVARAGVPLAIASGVIALVHALGALRDQRRTSGDQLLSQAKAHGTALHAERVHNAEVLNVLSARISATRESLASAVADAEQQRGKVVSLREELQTVHGRSTDLQHRLDELQNELSYSQETSAQQEAELFVLRAEAEMLTAESSAVIVGIPRRSRTDDGEDDVRTASAG